MYEDDIKVFTKKEKELKTLIQTIKIYSQYIGMEFDIVKYAMLITKNGKRKSEWNRAAKSGKHQNA